MSLHYRLLLSLSLVAGSCVPYAPLSAHPSSMEVFENKKIANINIQAEDLPPNVSFDAKATLARLKTQVGDVFSQMTFDEDLKALSNEYDRVEPLIEVRQGEVYLTIKLWPRPVIRAIQWKGATFIKPKTLRKELGIKPGERFNRPLFNKAFSKVKELYVKKGYFESQLQYSVQSSDIAGEVDIIIDVNEGRAGTIEHIVLRGFNSKEKSEILGMIYTKQHNLFTSWLTGSGTYREEALEQDRLTIINYLQNRGYADAKVEIEVTTSRAEDKILLILKVDKGERFHFGKISFNGNTLFTDKEIDSVFSARPGAVYSPDLLRDSMQSIKELYGRKGYINATVQYDTQLVPDQPLYNVVYSIDEGSKYKIGMVRIFGNVQTQTPVILRESLLIPGETFDSAKLKATEKRLENMGYFKSVNVYAVRTQDDLSLGENYRDVYIEVEETTTGNISLFFGFSSADDLFGGLDLAENNFNYKGIPFLFKDGPSALRGGGEYAHARANIGAKQRTYSLSWLTPYFRDTLWRVGFDVSQSNSNLISRDYDIETFGFSLYASYPLNSLWTFGTKYRFRNSMIHVPKHAPLQEQNQGSHEGVISGIGSSLSFDSTDSAVKPHNGFRSTLESEVVGVFGDYSYLRFAYINSYYAQLWRRGVMKYRWDVRFIEPTFKTDSPDKIPLSERFFIGGLTSVRGYKDFDLGPHFEKGDPTGGISSAVLSLEYLQEILPIADAFCFVDAGSIALKRFHLPQFRMTTGFGVRLELMNRVPIILGMGFPINRDKNSEMRQFFFSMGGQF